MPRAAATRDMNTLLEPFLVTRGDPAGRYDLEPFGLTVSPGLCYEATRSATGAVIDRLVQLDSLTFGPEGMPMPRWMFYELAALPGAAFGFGLDAGVLPDESRGRLGLGDDARGLVPVSMYIAIPIMPRVWCGHNLASLKRVLPELGLRRLASRTKAFALRCLRCEQQIGATQWDSDALFVHAKFGVLELLSAWTPAHEFPATLTYRLDVTEAGLRHALGEGDPPAAPPADFEIDADDHAAMRTLQTRIEAGERFAITGKPRVGEGVRRIPIARIG
ncbi:MAG TPA: hypothetical protein ENK57_07685 [Polyangiaceae bacterium]|nr:hypothetical protein [Polyangiaceae bacterium]